MATNNQTEPVQLSLLYNDSPIQHTSGQNYFDSYTPASQTSDPIGSKEVPAGSIKSETPSPKVTSDGPVWEPMVLRLPATIAFLTILLAIIAGLEAFLHLSHGRHGFPVPSTTVQAALTYIPVVVLVCISWFWQTFELEVMKLAPWADMRKKAIQAKDSLLLDYIGANYVSMLLNTLKRRHWPVLLTIVGSVSLAVSTVVATSLWVIGPQAIPFSNIALQRTSSFAVDDFNNVTNGGYLTQYVGGVVYPKLPLPLWMTPDYAMASFRIADRESTSGIITAETEALSADLTCQSLPVTNARNTTRKPTPTEGQGNITTWSVNVTWSGCDYHLDFVSKSSFCDNMGVGFRGPTGYLSRTYNLECAGMRTTAVIVGNFSTIKPEAYVGITCTPTYQKSTVDVVVNASSYKILEPVVVKKTEENVTIPLGRDLMAWIDLAQSQSLPCGNYVAKDSLKSWEWPNLNQSSTFNSIVPSGWLDITYRACNLTFDDIMNVDKLMDSSKKVFHDIFPYLAQEAYTKPISDAFVGVRSYTDTRLTSKTSSVRIVQGAIIVLVVIVAALYFLHPVTHLRHDPGSISTAAAVLAASPEVSECFSGTGSMSLSALKKHLEQTTFRTGHNRDGALTIAVQGSPSASSPSTVKLWRPLMLTIPAKIVVILLLAAGVAALEILLTRSKKNDGLADANTSRWEDYSWTYAAPAVLFILGLLIKSVDFAVRAAVPYAELASAQQHAQVLSYSPLFYGLYTLVPRSIRHKMYIIAFSALMVLLVAATKIAVAGVFTTGHSMTTQSQVDLRALSTFNGTYVTNVTNRDAVSHLFALTSIDKFGLQRPAWTTDEYAIGSVELPKLLNGARLSLRLPVLYTTLENCNIEKPTFVARFNFTDQFSAYLTYEDTECSMCGPSCFPNTIQAGPAYWGWVVKPDYGATGSNSTAPCVNQTRFIYGESPPLDFNVTGKPTTTPRVASIACDLRMWTSTMNVDLIINDDSLLARVDGNSEQDRKRVVDFAYLNTMFDKFPTVAPSSKNVTTFFDPLFQVLTESSPQMNLSAFLDPKQLQTSLKKTWSSYWTLYAGQIMRIDLANLNQTVGATVIGQTARVVVDETPTRVLEGLLAALLFIMLVLAVCTSSDSGLTKPPFSIGAQMSMLADSQLVDLAHGQRSVGEDMWRGMWVKLGWWDRQSGSGERRYGIDVVRGGSE